MNQILNTMDYLELETIGLRGAELSEAIKIEKIEANRRKQSWETRLKL